MPELFLQKAINQLKYEFDVLNVSDAWETPSYGTIGPDFLNAAVLIASMNSSDYIKKMQLRPIEKKLGRIRTIDKYSPRTIDIDIVIWNGFLLDRNLWELPHIAVPVSQLLPNYWSYDKSESLIAIATQLKRSNNIKHRPEVIKL
jgi:2-amino-4-hydroxy-6-hydroxymethyldihydropteridine diphosphokinase